MSFIILGMDTSKNERVGYGIGTNETIQYFNSTVNGTLYIFLWIVMFRILDYPLKVITLQ